MKKSEIRKDYLLDKYVIISPGRAKRPRNLKVQNVVIEQPSPFTPDHIKKSAIIDSLGADKRRVFVVKNIFPAVTTNNKKAYGVQEVVIETPDPSRSLAELGAPQIRRVLEMYARRTRALERNKRLNHILCFKNEGPKSGASLQHAHSQIFATELVPPDIAREAKLVAEYKEKSGRSFYLDLIEQEMKSPRRVFEDKHVAVFTPYASMYHYEVWLFAKRPADNISRLKGTELAAFSRALHRVLLGIHKMGLAYNLFCHQITVDRHEHFYIKIQPRDSVWAGVELGSGLVINSVSPEKAAKYYRSQK